jgi:tungstate transport system substrate-binding protein
MIDQMGEEKMRSLTKTRIISIALILVIAGALGTYFLYPRPKTQLIISTTTSLYETGFLDVLEQSFEQDNPGLNVSFISQGTGQAIQTSKLGQADLILVHDPPSELSFLNDSYGVNRKIIAYNFFIIVGPSNDPAAVNGTLPLDALRKIKASGEAGQAVWVSRGDGSGTHSKEKRLWAAAGINYTQIRTESWYLEAGSGMTATLQLANQKNAYTLSDKASYLTNFAKGNIQLAKLVEGGKDMLNVYSVIACNPQKLPSTKFDAAMAFIKYLVSDKGQELFMNFGVKDFGEAIFKPWIPVAKSGNPADIKQMVEQYAYFQGSECPAQYRYNAGDLYG